MKLLKKTKKMIYLYILLLYLLMELPLPLPDVLRLLLWLLLENHELQLYFMYEAVVNNA